MVSLDSDVTDISAGDRHSCAIQDGLAFCWGRNSTSGILGNNSTEDSHVPVPVTGLGPEAPLLWGDLDCDGSVAIGDALKTARDLLGLSVSQTEPCPEIGAEVEVGGEIKLWGDVDCDGNVVIGDALKVARFLLGLSVSQTQPCPEMGATVVLE